MIQFLSDNECKFIIKSTLDKKWTYIDNGYRYFETSFVDDIICDKLITKFEQTTHIKIKNSLILRCLKFNNNDFLISHNFNYANIHNNLYQKTKFGIVIFLNSEYSGGEYYFNHIQLHPNTGYGVIYTMDDIGKLKKITKGSLYILMCHVCETEKNNLI